MPEALKWRATDDANRIMRAMRTVSYFFGGSVADFQVPDDLFEQFSRHMPYERRYSETEIQKAQKVLEAYMKRGAAGDASPNEILAACYVWNYLNTNPDPEHHIEGPIMIVDLKGDGEYIEYASPDDVDMVPDTAE